jgi:uncharacterized protein (TIGR02466 family)
MSIEIQPIFATAIYKNILRSPTANELKFLNSCDTTNQGTGNLMSKNRYLLDCEELTDLKNLFLEDIKTYVEQIMHIDKEIYITTSWLNIAGAGKQHNLHNHSNSILSGCYYIDVESSEPSINFSRMSQPFLFNLTAKTRNSFNSTEWSLPIRNNMLILFPSSCYHSVRANPTPNKRISISFDTFIKGTIGSKATGDNLTL